MSFGVLTGFLAVYDRPQLCEHGIPADVVHDDLRPRPPALGGPPAAASRRCWLARSAGPPGRVSSCPAEGSPNSMYDLSMLVQCKKLSNGRHQHHIAVDSDRQRSLASSALAQQFQRKAKKERRRNPNEIP